MKSSSTKLLYVFLCVCLFMASIGIQTVHAAPDIIVNSTANTSGTCATSGIGTCTLRDAITFANVQSGADIIVFDASLSGSMIVLAATLPNIADALTIDASALPSMVELSGSDTMRIMLVNSGISLMINHLMISHGYADGGAGIHNSGNLTVTNSTLYRNYAPNISSRGGGIYNNGGTVTITNTTFDTNRTYTGGGGGIFNLSGTVTIEDSTFTGNLTSTVGGAIYNLGTVAVARSTFSGNLSLYEGGAIYNSGTATISDNSNISGNQSQGSQAGAIFNNGTMDISDTTLSGNSSRCYGGGAIYNLSGALTITRTTLANNASYNSCSSSFGSRGGAIHIDNGTVIITNSTIYNNYAPDYGGGIYKNLGTLYLTNNTLSGNRIDRIDGGGGLYLNDGATHLVNTIIANSTNGDCYGYIGYLATRTNNLIEDSLFHCTVNDGENGNIVGQDPVLDALADNGGAAETMKLLSGSPAIDAGDDYSCHVLGFGDQRNYNRGLGGDHCDIGAYEVTGGIPIVSSSSPVDSATATGLKTITVTFDQDMLHDGSAEAANNTTNYLLVEQGENTTFDTLSCAGGQISDDTRVMFNSASYNTGTFTTTLNLSTALTAGNYRLLVCGTASIWSTNGIVLNNGDDTTIAFTALAGGSSDPDGDGGASTSSLSASSLPATGFAPDRITLLPDQPAGAAYTPKDSLRLLIPSLNVDVPIIGIPRTDNSWDVSWLGNDAGWLNSSAYPTWPGNTVLTGHVWNADNTPGIFLNLKDLQYGDRFEIEASGQTYTYEVRETKLISKGNTNTVFKHKELDWVTLLSCEQYDPVSDEYPYRRLVRAVLVKVE